MALNVEDLLAPVSDDQPAGEDLSYDRERTEIEQAFEREDQTFGDAGAEPEERDWRGVVRLIESQFARSKDLWLAAYLARAGAESGVLETVEAGVETLAGLLERYWDSVHPQLDELGVPGRKAPCDSLANRRSFLGPLERVILISHPRLGRFSAADVERFRSEGSAADGYGLFRATVDELGDASLQEALSRVEGIELALRRADQAFEAGAGGEESPNFGPTYAQLNQMKASLLGFLVGGATDGAAEEAGAPGAGITGGAGGAEGARSLSGAVNSRDDVVRVLNLVSDYYRKREPGHPMPLMMERATRWVTMDFVTLMKDIAPRGVDEATEVLRTRDGVLDED